MQKRESDLVPQLAEVQPIRQVTPANAAPPKTSDSKTRASCNESADTAIPKKAVQDNKNAQPDPNE